MISFEKLSYILEAIFFNEYGVKLNIKTAFENLPNVDLQRAILITIANYLGIDELDRLYDFRTKAYKLLEVVREVDLDKRTQNFCKGKCELFEHLIKYWHDEEDKNETKNI